MDRKKFIKTCGIGCVGMLGGLSLLQSCAGTKYITGQLSGPSLLVPLSSFEEEKKGEKGFRRYVVVQNEKLEYPICVYRFSDTDFSAVLMRCTHQGTELQVFGDRLQCPAHGSEFSSTGAVQNGPADKSLRRFLIDKENDMLKIDLA
ncbi:MAG: Rieske (2Fe-2S) protein [Imperialibacter sp.]|uniref:Rieske (2Fe-2S) protein n=1 Tax=Imperialibacter sp. TaxID=2038411 RepID=UPI0032F090F5